MTTSLLILARALHLGGGLILVGVVAFRWLVLLPAFAVEADETWRALSPLFVRLNQLFLWSGATLLISGILLFWAVSGAMSDTSLIESLSADTLGTVLLQTQFGSVSQWRLGLAVVLLVPMVVLARTQWQSRRHRSAVEVVAGLTATALMVSFAWTGHAAASGGFNAIWRIAADALHLFVASIWPTGLLPFALFLACAKQSKEPSILPATIKAIGRFSNISLGIVGVLTTTGLINAFFMLGKLSTLFSTTYGQVLCLKLLLFALMLGIAAYNRFHLLRLLSLRDLPPDQDISALLRRLQRFVTAEIALAFGVIVVVSFLGTTPPPQ
jgi:putative copper resistance protein D